MWRRIGPCLRRRGAQFRRFLLAPLWAIGLALWADASAWGANWQLSGRDETGTAWYVDADSVAPQDEYLHAWLKARFPEDHVEPGSGEAYRDELQSVIIDCERGAFAVVEVFLRSDSGRILDRAIAEEETPALVLPPASSIAAASIGHACALWENVVAEEARRLRDYLQGDLWVRIAAAEDGAMEVYVNPDTVSRTGDSVIALLQYRHAVPTFMAGHLVRYVLMLEYFDCRARKRAPAGAIGVSPDGRIIGRYHEEKPLLEGLDKVVPGSLGDKAMRHFCGESGPAAARGADLPRSPN